MVASTKTKPAPNTGNGLPPIKFAGIRAKNVCSLKLLELDLNGKSLVVSGSNASGKTTVLRTFLLGLGQLAGKEIPESVLKGEDGAEIDLTLCHAETGEKLFRIHRECTKNKWAPIVVKDARTGEKRERPQEFVDSFINHVCLNPWLAMDMRPQDQVDFVLRIGKVPLPIEEVKRITGVYHPPIGDETAAQYLLRLSADKTGKYYDERRRLNSEWEQKKKALAEQAERLEALVPLPADDGADIGELQKRRETLDQKREQRRALQQNAASIKVELETNEGTLAGLPVQLAQAQRQVSDTEAEIARLQSRLIKEKEAVAGLESRINRGKTIVAEIRAEWEAAEDAAKALPDPTPQIDAIDEQIRTIDARRNQIAKRQAMQDEHDRLHREADAAEARHAKADIMMEEFRELRLHLLDNVPLGVPGLTVGEGGLRLNDLPFKEQASKSQQGRTWYRLARYQNPGAPFMFMDDAERFDAMGRAELLQEAARDGIQMLMAVVRDDSCEKCHGAGGKCDECLGTGRVNAPLQFQVVDA